ncbi:uncharacterized protein MEPE_01207 [Melanopsichium pennsylvanicum]|uniref:BTB domain-containing protein n=2 Tax=Melanopsichium pennsylvanicum TaxID=63383 RepID=A0AAJ5C3D1_9BASI|nr:conserved hypothetical protein [Melanopsichium pennsylvanicum 4]SNX82501.1 uncharacterized protein MEPE_01207 [Melanopsichium pennsylvanicum]
MQHHIYELGLLGGRCSDIRIRAFGRIYHLHRLILIQSGFFRAMLCGGYAEDLAAASIAATLSKKNGQPESHTSSNIANTSSTAHRDPENDVVDLHFDDPNISRAAFEYCIARLYGDGPKLVLPFWSNSSLNHPFSPALTMRLSQSSDLQLADLLIDKRSHPATPRFLLSLLATSIYLNIPSVTAQALTLVLCSVTPFTVTQYLRFAIGCGIEGTDLHRSASDEMLHDLDEWDWELEGPARTLEEIARIDANLRASPHSQPSQSSQDEDSAVSDDLTDQVRRKLSMNPSPSGSKHASTTSFERYSSHIRAGQSFADIESQTPGREEKRNAKKTAGFRESEPAGLAMQATSSITPEFQYGLTADKIGEACVCWFARWGYDSFELECSMERERIIEIETWIRMCREDGDITRLALLRDRLQTGDADLLHTSMLPRGRMPDAEERMPSPRLRVWSYPSMPSIWVRAIISSDSFFVPSELHRYEFAKKVTEFRRKQKALINVLDRLIDGWTHEGEEKKRETEASDSSKKMGGATKAPSSSAASSDAGDGFGFKAFRRASSFNDDDDVDAATTPLQEAWNDCAESTTFSASLDEDEAEYEELFSSGIYYSHMPFQALNKISLDVSPTTGRPYTPLNVLQAALWVSNELKAHILSSTNSPRRSSVPTTPNEAEADSEAASNESQDPMTQDMDGVGELGVSSSIAQFRDAFESTLSTANSQRRFSRSRSGTPIYMGDDNNATLSFGSASGLGGLAASPLMLGAHGGGTAGLLRKKYYLVPSDDTVRFGDGLTAVVGSTVPTASNSSRTLGSDDERAYPGSAFADDHLGPSGTAAIQIPHTLPIQAVMQQDPSNTSFQRRDRSHYYGIANDVATGHELGEHAYRHLNVTSGTSTRASNARESDKLDNREAGAHSHDPNEDANAADAESVSSADVSPERWSGYEPMRVGVEFFGIDKLQEKQRLYSPTFFYAGSVWNLYVQVVKKVKGIQLGIYLHRQSLMEQLPPPSAPTPTVEEEGSQGEGTGGGRGASGTTTPRGRFDHGERVSASRNRAQQRNWMFTGSTLEDTEEDSFFDTSFTSPVRAGMHGHSASVGIGSTLTLPSGRSVTRLANGGNSPLRSNLADPLERGDAEGSAENRAVTLSSFPTLPDLGSSPLNGPSTSQTLFTNNLNDNTSLPNTRDAHSRSTTQNLNATSTAPSRPPIIPLYPNGPSVYATCPTPQIPYRDPRKELRAYFSIHCPSPLGTALTKFSSGPDKFTISQSWGWKSSSLLATVHLQHGDLKKAKQALCFGFRCVCTIGLV